MPFVPKRLSISLWLLVPLVALLSCEPRSSATEEQQSEDQLERSALPMEENDNPWVVAAEQENARPIEAMALPDGAREVILSVNGEQVRVTRQSQTNPFVVAGGEFTDAFPPLPGGGDGPIILLTDTIPIDVIRRVPQEVEISVSDPDGVGNVTGYYVQFEGYEGCFFVPTEVDSEIFGARQLERGRFNLGFFLDEVFPPGTERGTDWADQYYDPFDVEMQIWAVDRDRNVSPPVSRLLHILPVGRGDFEVTLSMALPTDLDLYVVEPNGNVIYYGNLRSWTNGQLDLDANAACASNRNVRYEHIFWPEGRVPEGSYQIRVDNWRNCVGGQPVDFEVIVQNCGDITVYEGTAAGAGGQSDCRSAYQASCQDIATVEVEACDDPTPDGETLRNNYR